MLSATESNKKKLCVVPVCRHLRFALVHKFPMSLERAELWRTALNIPELTHLDWPDIRKRLFVCSRHFLLSDYKNMDSKNLNWNAVPSINLTTFDDFNCMDTCTFDVSPENHPTPSKKAKLTPPPAPSPVVASTSAMPEILQPSCPAKESEVTVKIPQRIQVMEDGPKLLKVVKKKLCKVKKKHLNVLVTPTKVSPVQELVTVKRRASPKSSVSSPPTRDVTNNTDGEFMKVVETAPKVLKAIPQLQQRTREIAQAYLRIEESAKDNSKSYKFIDLIEQCEYINRFCFPPIAVQSQQA